MMRSWVLACRHLSESLALVLWGIYLGVSSLGNTLYLTFWWFPQQLNQLAFPPATCVGFTVPTILPTLLFIFNLAALKGLMSYLTVVWSAFPEWLAILSIFSCAYCPLLCLLCRNSAQVLCPFLIWVVCRWVVRVLIKSCTSDPYPMQDVHKFSPTEKPSWRCAFLYKFLILMKSSLPLFGLGVIFKKNHWQTQSHENLHLCFPLRILLFELLEYVYSCTSSSSESCFPIIFSNTFSAPFHLSAPAGTPTILMVLCLLVSHRPLFPFCQEARIVQ